MSVTGQKVLDLLGIEYVNRTNRLSFLCPLHHDTSPSAAFYEDTELFYCFSCSYTLDPPAFYAKIAEISRSDARRDLEKQFGEGKDRKLKHDESLLRTERIKVERKLKEVQHLDMKEHATLGEMVDRILLSYERGQIDKDELKVYLKIWNKKVQKCIPDIL